MANLKKQELRHDAVHEELEKITVTVVKKRNTILLIALVILALAVAASQYAGSKKKTRANAENLLLSAGTNLLAVAEVPAKYPGTHAAKAALLTLASDAVANTNYTLAAEYYTRVATEFPEDECADAAWLGAARCKIGLSDFAGAREIVSKHFSKGNHVNNGKYLLFKIAALEGKDDEALALAEELVAAVKEVGTSLTEDIVASIKRKQGDTPAAE